MPLLVRAVKQYCVFPFRRIGLQSAVIVCYGLLNEPVSRIVLSGWGVLDFGEVTTGAAVF